MQDDSVVSPHNAGNCRQVQQPGSWRTHAASPEQVREDPGALVGGLPDEQPRRRAAQQRHGRLVADQGDAGPVQVRHQHVDDLRSHAKYAHATPDEGGRKTKPPSSLVSSGMNPNNALRLGAAMLQVRDQHVDDLRAAQWTECCAE